MRRPSHRAPDLREILREGAAVVDGKKAGRVLFQPMSPLSPVSEGTCRGSCSPNVDKPTALAPPQAATAV